MTSNENETFLFTSESVGEGIKFLTVWHPQDTQTRFVIKARVVVDFLVSDAILDACLAQDKFSRGTK